MTLKLFVECIVMAKQNLVIFIDWSVTSAWRKRFMIDKSINKVCSDVQKIYFVFIYNEFCGAMFCQLVVVIYHCVLVCKNGFLFSSLIEMKEYCFSILNYFYSNICKRLPKK